LNSKSIYTKNTFIFVASLAIISAAIIFITSNKPIGDFGNYYYGSKLFAEGKNLDSLYQDIHWFNSQIKLYGEKDYFENYIPVPPANLLFYAPFTFLSSQSAKLIFNIFCLLILIVSLTRYLKLIPDLKFYYLFALPVILFPLYTNFLQGQSYILILALLLEIYINYYKKQYYLIAVFIAMLFQIKLFPVFILGYFIFKKEYKIVLLSCLMILLFTLLIAITVGKDLVVNYYSEIVPRLFKNEIVDPFYTGHQSINILLKKLFCLDELSNPSPIIDLPVAVVILESILVCAIIYIAFYIVKLKNTILSYSLFIFFGILAGKYITAYSLILLLPFAFSLFSFKRSGVYIVILFLICNIPLSYLENFSFPLKYIRILFMLILFCLIVSEIKPKINYKQSGIIFILVLSLTMFSSKKYPDNYFVSDNKKGIGYDFTIVKNKILLNKCLGSYNKTDSLLLNFNVTNLKEIMPKDIYKYSEEVNGKQNIKKAVILNDSLLLYLSDLQQGAGMNKLRMVKVKH